MRFMYGPCTKPAVTIQMVQVDQKRVLRIKKEKISSKEDIVDSPLCYSWSNSEPGVSTRIHRITIIIGLNPGGKATFQTEPLFMIRHGILSDRSGKSRCFMIDEAM